MKLKNTIHTNMNIYFTYKEPNGSCKMVYIHFQYYKFILSNDTWQRASIEKLLTYKLPWSVIDGFGFGAVSVSVSRNFRS